MRMWMVDPRGMCREHLLGEHGELHKFLHNWIRQHSIVGRVAGNAMEPMAYKARHDALAAEMLRRGFKHASILEQPDFSYLPEVYRFYRVDVDANLALLHERCPQCKEMSHGS